MLLHQKILNRGSKDFIWSILNGIFTVLAFISSVFVNFGHVAKFVLQERKFWVIMFRSLMQLENQSFTKISHLLK